MLEWSEGLADLTKHHILEIQGLRPRVSDRPYLPSGLPLSQQKQNTTKAVQCILSGKFAFLVLTPHGNVVSPVMISILILL
jgi:hypothetical protein